MLYIEDALKLIADSYWKYNRLGNQSTGDWHVSFIQNVSDHVSRGKPLSTEQSKIVIKILSKMKHFLVSAGDVSEQAIDDLIQNPKYRQQPYQSANIRKEVRYLGANLIGFRFKFNDVIMRDIRAISDVQQGAFSPWFDRDFRIWVVPISRYSLEKVREIISKHRFEMDTNARDYLALCACSKDKPSTVVYDSETTSFILNVCDDDVFVAWANNVVGSEFL